MVFAYRQRGLGATLTLHGDETAPQTVRLAPGGTIRGRLLSPDGKPCANAGIGVVTGRPADRRFFTLLELMEQAGYGPTITRTDRDGRFRLTALMPGVTYQLKCRRSPWAPATARRVKAIVTAAGTTIDLGDLATLR